MTAPASYRFPAEWEPHSATWLTWPHNEETWPENLVQAQSEFETFARTLAEVENVCILATGLLATQLTKRFRHVERISVHPISTNDSWIRDYGPTFVKSLSGDASAGIDWIYDGWGQKYPPFDDDQKAAGRILKAANIPRIESELVLEGGSIDSNGQSLALTTRRCQLRRNPDWTEKKIIAELEQQLGLDQVLMVDCVEIERDDTDGHIDQVARFVSENQVAVSHRQKNTVRSALEQAGLEIIELPDPGEVRRFGQLLPTSYTNFYIANEIVVVPCFDTAQDAVAISLLDKVFSDRQVIGLPSVNLAVGLGSFHCLTQQQPA